LNIGAYRNLLLSEFYMIKSDFSAIIENPLKKEVVVDYLINRKADDFTDEHKKLVLNVMQNQVNRVIKQK